MISATDALDRLRAGNRRFVSEQHRTRRPGQSRRNEPVEGQAPLAIILGCSDSRVPAEIVFDQGLGDLFVIRVAGNVVAPSQIGSVEFAVEGLMEAGLGRDREALLHHAVRANTRAAAGAR
jgi:carbonic anhydrase